MSRRNRQDTLQPAAVVVPRKMLEWYWRNLSREMKNWHFVGRENDAVVLKTPSKSLLRFCFPSCQESAECCQKPPGGSTFAARRLRLPLETFPFIFLKKTQNFVRSPVFLAPPPEVWAGAGCSSQACDGSSQMVALCLFVVPSWWVGDFLVARAVCGTSVFDGTVARCRCRLGFCGWGFSRVAASGFLFRCFQGRLVAKFVYFSFCFLFFRCISVCFLDSGVWNAGIILFMYLFILFHIDKKIAVKWNCLSLHPDIWQIWGFK